MIRCPGTLRATARAPRCPPVAAVHNVSPRVRIYRASTLSLAERATSPQQFQRRGVALVGATLDARQGGNDEKTCVWPRQFCCSRPWFLKMLLRNAGEELGWAALALVLSGGWAALALALSGGLWVASAVLVLARLAAGLVLAGAAAPAWSVALLLAPLWAGIRAGGFGAPLGGAGIRAGGSDARPGGAHRSRSGSDLGPSPMGPVTDGTRIMGTM